MLKPTLQRLLLKGQLLRRRCIYPVISGVGTISEVLIFNSGVGYYPVFSTSTGSEVVVERGAFGTISTDRS